MRSGLVQFGEGDTVAHEGIGQGHVYPSTVRADARRTDEGGAPDMDRRPCCRDLSRGLSNCRALPAPVDRVAATPSVPAALAGTATIDRGHSQRTAAGTRTHRRKPVERPVPVPWIG